MISEDNNNFNGPAEVNEPGGRYQQQEPLNFEKIWMLFQDTDKKFQETDKKMQETDRKMRETDNKIKETDRILTEQSQETRKSLKRLSKIASGLGINIGEATEDYFYNALEHMRSLAGNEIEKVDVLKRSVKGLQGQFDAVLFCSNDVIILVEIKHKLHLEDVIRFKDKTISVFRQLYPEYSSQKVLGAVAGMTISDEAMDKALSYGLLVLTQSNQKIRILNPEGFAPKVF